tara:strand:+ start:80 stop:478 length:399 start_codon:yes stop_codon:yes gene_type:complete
MTRARSLSRLGNSQALTVSSDLNVGVNSTSPVEKLNVVGVVSATSFYGSGANLTDVISGIELNFGGNSLGTGVTNIDFVGFSSVTAPVSGLATVTTSKQLTIGVRVGSAVTFSIVGAAFTVDGRSAAITIDA